MDWLFVIAVFSVIIIVAVSSLYLPFPDGTLVATVQDATSFIELVAQVSSTFAGFLIVAFTYLIGRKGFSFRKKGYFDESADIIALGLGIMFFVALSLLSLLLFIEIPANNSIIYARMMVTGIVLILRGAIFFTVAGLGGRIAIKILREFYGFDRLRIMYNKRVE